VLIRSNRGHCAEISRLRVGGIWVGGREKTGMCDKLLLPPRRMLYFGHLSPGKRTLTATSTSLMPGVEKSASTEIERSSRRCSKAPSCVGAGDFFSEEMGRPDLGKEKGRKGSSPAGARLLRGGAISEAMLKKGGWVS